jgi:hypothetical protein
MWSGPAGRPFSSCWWARKDLPVGRGTTLIAVATDDGIVMAADDLVYVEKGGEVIPSFHGVQKVFVAAENILIGSAGMMANSQIEYKFDDWISRFIESNCSGPGKLPSDVASALYREMQETFEPIASSPESPLWQTHKPGDRVASYVIAGYSKSFQQAYSFEIGAEVNGNGSGLQYIQPIRRSGPNMSLSFGEDQFFGRAQQGLDPEYSAHLSILDDVLLNVRKYLPLIPSPMQEAVASVVSLIKVEAQFNPQKIGSGVRLGLIDRKERASYVVAF